MASELPGSPVQVHPQPEILEPGSSGEGIEISHSPEKKAFYPANNERTLVQTLSRKRVWLPIISLIIIAVIVIPTAIVLTRRDSSGGSGSSGGSEAPAGQSPSSDASRESALDIAGDTRLAVVNNYGGDDLLFYQLASGSLGFTFLTNEGFGESHDLQVSDARDPTPLAAVSQLRPDGSRYWWVFYVNDEDIVHGLYSNENPEVWTSGSLGAFNVRASDQTDLAFATGHRQYDSALQQPSGDFSFFVCTEHNIIQEFIGDENGVDWRPGFTIRGRGCRIAGVAEGESQTYLFTQSEDVFDGVQLWARNHSSNSDDWEVIETPGIFATSGFCAGANYTAFQSPYGEVNGRMFDGRDEEGIINTIRYPGGDITIDSSSAITSNALGCRYSGERLMVSYLAENGSILSATSEGLSSNTVGNMVRQNWTVEVLSVI